MLLNPYESPRLKSPNRRQRRALRQSVFWGGIVGILLAISLIHLSEPVEMYSKVGGTQYATISQSMRILGVGGIIAGCIAILTSHFLPDRRLRFSLGRRKEPKE